MNHMEHVAVHDAPSAAVTRERTQQALRSCSVFSQEPQGATRRPPQHSYTWHGALNQEGRPSRHVSCSSAPGRRFPAIYEDSNESHQNGPALSPMSCASRSDSAGSSELDGELWHYAHLADLAAPSQDNTMRTSSRSNQLASPNDLLQEPAAVAASQPSFSTWHPTAAGANQIQPAFSAERSFSIQSNPTFAGSSYCSSYDAAVRAQELTSTCSGQFDSVASAASDDWYAAANSSGMSTPYPCPDVSPWEATISSSQPGSTASYAPRSSQQQFTGIHCSSSNSSGNSNNSGVSSSSADHSMPPAATYSMPVTSLQGPFSAFELPVAGPVSPKKLSTSASGNRSYGGFTSSRAQQVLLQQQQQQQSPSRAASALLRSTMNCPLPRAPMVAPPALQQQQQQQQQQQHRQALLMLEEEVQQLLRLGRQLEAAKAAAAAGSPAAAACEVASAMHHKAMKRASAALAALQQAGAGASHDPTPELQLQQHDYQHHWQQEQEQQRQWQLQQQQQQQPPHNPVCRSASFAAQHPSLTGQEPLYRSASGRLSAGAQGKLAQLQKVQMMQAALQDELLQLLPMT